MAKMGGRADRCKISMIEIVLQIIATISFIYLGLECFLCKPKKKVSGVILLNFAIVTILTLAFFDEKWFLPESGKIVFSVWRIISAIATIAVFIMRFVLWIKGERLPKIFEAEDESKEEEDE